MPRLLSRIAFSESVSGTRGRVYSPCSPRTSARLFLALKRLESYEIARLKVVVAAERSPRDIWLTPQLLRTAAGRELILSALA